MDRNAGVKKRCDTCKEPRTITKTSPNGDLYVLDCGHTAIPEHKKYGP